MKDSREVINDMLVKLFNDIISIEAAALRNSEFVDLTVTEFHVIEAIGLGVGRTMSETAHMTGVTIGTLTSTVNRLIAKGAVQRKRDDRDRRVVMLSLTEKGKRAYHHHENFHQEMTDSIMEALQPEDDAALIRTLEALQQFFSRKAHEYGRI